MNLVHQRKGVILIRLLPGVVGEVVQVVQHLCAPVLGPLQGPVVEHVKAVRKEVRLKHERIGGHINLDLKQSQGSVFVEKLLFFTFLDKNIARIANVVQCHS